MKFDDMDCLTIDSFFEFCRGDSNIKVLEVEDCAIGGGATALPPHDEGRQETIVLTLEKLAFDFVSFRNSAALYNCAKFVAANIHLSALVLGIHRD